MVIPNSTTLRIYSDPRGLASHRIRLIVAEKSIPCQVIDTDPLHLPDDIMDLNPYGSLPTLVERDLALYDTQIISEYLNDRFPHPPLMPTDPASRAMLRMYMYRIEKDWQNLAENILADNTNSVQACKLLAESLTASVPIFSAKTFFMSDEYTLSDTSLAPLLWRLPLLKLPLGGTVQNQINHYAKRLFTRPAFIKSLTEAEKQMR